MSADNIILNSCQYTPVYLIESPGVGQARSYFLTPNNQSVDKPVSESLKRFYESSGNLESNLNNAESASKPKLIKKQENNIVGNNLKLASFLLPKCETKNELMKPIITSVNNVLLKPVYITNNISVNNVNTPSQVPKIDVNSRLVKLKDLPNIVRSQNGKILPKIKPKENTTTNKQKQNAVQLVKLGETYHSLNQLNNDQMKIVNHALKIFNNPQSGAPEPAYDHDINTKFIYKVVPQKDFAATDKNKINKQINPEIKKEPIKVEESDFIEEEPKIPVETTVTRSGRVVKLPKNIIVDDSPTKPRKRNSSIVCLQCTSKFSSPQRLHRHYENHPTHLPFNFHNNLFHCLVAIVSACSESERGTLLINQLEHLIDKLKSCVPCLLKTNNNNVDKSTLINGDLSRLLGLNPGKYNLNTDALSCEKDSEGYCNHNPRPPPLVSIDSTKPQILLLENSDSGLIKSSHNILKTNYLDRRPTILRKVEFRKQKLELSSHINNNGKKIKLSQDNDTNSDNLGIDDIVALLSDTAKTESNTEAKSADKIVVNGQKEADINTAPEKNMPKPPHIQFHSTHFDIRSSPIKPSSTVFRTFQIRPEKMANYEVEIMRPLQLNQLATDDDKRTHNHLDPQEIFKERNITSKQSEHLNYDPSNKDWSCGEPSFMNPTDLMNSETDNFMQPNSLIQPELLHSKDNVELRNDVTNQADFMKTNILMESEILLAQDNSNVSDTVSDQAHDFMKSNILIEPALMHTQDHCNVPNNITDSTDFIKSNVILEPTLLNSQDEPKMEDTFTEEAHNFITDSYIEPPLSQTNDINKVTPENEIDIDLPTGQGQSIMSFLESLGNELDYTETENRNNPVDFQLDLFSFNNS